MMTTRRIVLGGVASDVAGLLGKANARAIDHALARSTLIDFLRGMAGAANEFVHQAAW
jgi:hypothetical protein